MGTIDYKNACGLNWPGLIFSSSSWIVSRPEIFWSETGSEPVRVKTSETWASSTNWSKGIRGCHEPKCGLRKVASVQMRTEFPWGLNGRLGPFLQTSRKRVLTIIGLFDQCVQVLKWTSFKYVCITLTRLLINHYLSMNPIMVKALV